MEFQLWLAKSLIASLATSWGSSAQGGQMQLPLVQVVVVASATANEPTATLAPHRGS